MHFGKMSKFVLFSFTRRLFFQCYLYLDINECDSPNPCGIEHPENRDCVNTEGGVACPCKPGYTYNDTSGRCEGNFPTMTQL